VIETLDDHSASITTVKFACNGSKLLSCSADKYVFQSFCLMKLHQPNQSDFPAPDSNECLHTLNNATTGQLSFGT
jgi:WD40 repeat protein